MDYDLYNDEQLVDGIVNNNRPLIEYFFQKKCSKLVAYICFYVFEGKVDKRELVNELYLFMAYNDWQIFRQFQYRSSLMTYIRVVAVRFFLKKRAKQIELLPTEDFNDDMKCEYNYVSIIEQRMDICAALKKMPNARYRQVIEALNLQDVQPEKLAQDMNVTVDNLYNIHRRALVQLRLVMGRREEYV